MNSNITKLYEENKNLLEEYFKTKGFKSTVEDMLNAVLEFGIITPKELYKKLERKIKRLTNKKETEEEAKEQKENPKQYTTINGKPFNKKEKTIDRTGNSLTSITNGFSMIISFFLLVIGSYYLGKYLQNMQMQ